MIRLWMVTFLCAIWATGAWAAPRISTETEATFQKANAVFNEATRIRATDPERAEALYASSIELYQQVLSDPAVAPGAVHYNIGNAYFLSGDTGRAILHYRRAQRELPHSADVAANLGAARARVATRIESAPSSRALVVLLGWHDDIPASVRFTLGLGAFAAAWLLAAARLLLGATTARIVASRWLIASCAVTAVAAAVSLGVEYRERAGRQEAVVVADEVIGRKGPDEVSYEPSFAAPLHAGVEARIIERRADWVLVELRDGRTTWLEAGAIEVI